VSRPASFWLGVAALLLAVVAFARFLDHPLGEPSAEPIPWSREPVQAVTDRAPFRHEAGGRGFALTPRAAYDVSAVVAGVSRYRFDDLADLAPVDAVLTWGELPEPPYAGRVRYDQMARFYLWSTRARDLDLRYVERHSANVHLVPANANVGRALVRLGEGDTVRLLGLLVDAVEPGGEHWKTSVTRSDTGAGACELLWVEEVRIGGQRYR
jgi:hypothetical protein